MTQKMTEQKAAALLEETLLKNVECHLKDASAKELYKALAIISRDLLAEKREKFHSKVAKNQKKRVHYLCMEFLLGRNLKTALFNLGLDRVFEKVLKAQNISIEDVYEQEFDAGLGNGGLGRLAACFMDSLAHLGYPSMGHSILYEYGLFKQKIVDGEQIELIDSWRSTGDYWLKKRPDKSCIIKFGGYVTEKMEGDRLIPEYHNYTEVQAIPYDMVLSGYDSGDGVSVLRLWEAKAINKFDLASFSQGAYVNAVAEASEIEMISKVLYPADDHQQGKALRLEQQYFLVSASLQNIISTHIKRQRDLRSLSKMVAIHINDTHPSLCIPELMRILMDEHGWNWDSAWNMVTKVVGYTNHTVLAEALEKWDENLFRNTLPRIYQIVKEINRRFVDNLLQRQDEFDLSTIERMSIVSQNQVRMANLSVIGSHKINGVSRLHSDIIKNDIFNSFAKLWPEKFTNVTNGIAHRRWLCQSNRNLTSYIDSLIGNGYYYNPDDLTKLLKYSEDKTILNKLAKIKHANKVEFADYLYKTQGVKVDPTHRFDVHVKRIHEYKRQLLNVLKIIYLYEDLKKNPNKDITPQVFFFGGKSAAKYFMAKRIIKLICKLAKDIDSNPLVCDKIKVVFLENYCVSLAEKIIPATEVSEQISLAGKEASGTGNMKFMINGALTLGTFDGANVEMSECVGRDNIFIFGLSSEEVDNAWRVGYNPREIYNSNEKIKVVIDSLRKGFDGESFEDIANYLIGDGRPDPYMCLIDFDSYLNKHNEMDRVYRNPIEWNRMSLINIAKSGFFASDRSINDYAKDIWKIDRVK